MDFNELYQFGIDLIYPPHLVKGFKILIISYSIIERKQTSESG